MQIGLIHMGIKCVVRKRDIVKLGRHARLDTGCHLGVPDGGGCALDAEVGSVDVVVGGGADTSEGFGIIDVVGGANDAGFG